MGDRKLTRNSTMSPVSIKRSTISSLLMGYFAFVFQCSSVIWKVSWTKEKTIRQNEKFDNLVISTFSSPASNIARCSRRAELLTYLFKLLYPFKLTLHNTLARGPRLIFFDFQALNFRHTICTLCCHEELCYVSDHF